MYSNLFPSASNNKRQHSPYFLNPADLQILAEPEIYRKRGERVEDALYRDSQKRSARHKLMIESVSLTFTVHYAHNNYEQVALFMKI